MATKLSGLLAELKRRKVTRVAVAYVIAGIAVVEGADIIGTPLGLSEGLIQAAAFLVVLGFPVFTLGLMLGALNAYRLWGHIFDWREQKEVFSLITWLVFAAYLHARGLGGWRGRRMALLLVVGFLLVVITYLGTAGARWHAFGG